jgi:hypothetical protein
MGRSWDGGGEQGLHGRAPGHFIGSSGVVSIYSSLATVKIRWRYRSHWEHESLRSEASRLEGIRHRRGGQLRPWVKEDNGSGRGLVAIVMALRWRRRRRRSPSSPRNSTWMSRPRFFPNLKFHHAFMAYCISNLFQSFEPYSSENIVKCPFSQVFVTKAFRKKVFYKWTPLIWSNLNCSFSKISFEKPNSRKVIF